MYCIAVIPPKIIVTYGGCNEYDVDVGAANAVALLRNARDLIGKAKDVNEPECTSSIDVCCAVDGVRYTLLIRPRVFAITPDVRAVYALISDIERLAKFAPGTLTDQINENLRALATQEQLTSRPK